MVLHLDTTTTGSRYRNIDRGMTTSVAADLALTQPVVGLSDVKTLVFTSKKAINILPSLGAKQYEAMVAQQIKQAKEARALLKEHSTTTATTAATKEGDEKKRESDIRFADELAASLAQRPTFVPGFRPDDVNIDMNLLRSEYAEGGLRVTVEAVVLVHDHGHPHVLVLQAPSGLYRLPGAALDQGEDEVPALQMRLKAIFRPAITTEEGDDVDDDVTGAGDWHVGPLVGTWWRPAFEGHVYPYVAAHVTKPKEMRKLFLVQARNGLNLAVPDNYRLLAVPLFDVFDNALVYGHVIASLPACLSRFFFQYL